MQGLLKYGLLYFVFLTATGISSGKESELEYFRDSSTQLSPTEIQNSNISWQKTAYNKANFGFISDALWIRVPFNNPTSSEVIKHLRINYLLMPT
jgi:hypothetical protein